MTQEVKDKIKSIASSYLHPSVAENFMEVGYSLSEKELEEKDKEIERLRGLIELAYDRGYADYDELVCRVRNNWEKFKSENNL